MTDSAVRIFVTVGSTKFTHLVAAVTSHDVIEALGDAGSTQSKAGKRSNVHITVQYGATPLADVLTEKGCALARLEAGISGQRQEPDGGEMITSLLPQRKDDPQHAKHATGGLLEDQELSKTFRLDARSKHDVDDDEEVENTDGKEGAARPSGSSLSVMQMRLERPLIFRIPTSSGSIVVLELIDYVDSIRPFLEKSDVVVSHAGSGTILEALRLRCPPKLVVVPNETLMDNHQTELALALAQQRYLLATRVGSAGTPNRLSLLLAALIAGDKEGDDRPSTATVPFPAFVPGRFCALMDEQMGYSAPQARELHPVAPLLSLQSLLSVAGAIIERFVSFVASPILAAPDSQAASLESRQSANANRANDAS